MEPRANLLARAQEIHRFTRGPEKEPVENEPMKTPQSLLPDLPTLRERLTIGLADASRGRHPVKVLKRNPPPFMSTFANEIVTCQLPGGRKRRVFIKYGGGGRHPLFFPPAAHSFYGGR